MKKVFLALTTMTILSALVLSNCSGGGGGGGGDTGGSTGDSGATLDTAGGATTVASSGTLTIGVNSANTTDMNVTWSLSCPAGSSDCGTITPATTGFADYKAPDEVTDRFDVTVTATSVQDPSRSWSLELTVCPARAELLNGQYAFLLQGFNINSGAGIAAVGSFTADGCGAITGGAADYHLGYYLGTITAGNDTSLNGTYAIKKDHSGTLSMTVSSITKTFAIALGKIGNGVASQGAMTQTAWGDPPTSTRLSGSMWRQDPAAFLQSAITGPYAFVFNGWNASQSYGPREAMGGTVSADGAGYFGTGLLDDKVFGASPVTTAWTGTYGVPSNTGRMVLTASALTGTQGNAVLYMVNAGHLVTLISDTSGAGRVFSGSMLAQQTGPFGLGSLKGNCVTLQTANYSQPSYEFLTTSTLALFDADGAGNLLIKSYDQNDGANIYHGGGINYTYTVEANGQATITTGSVIGGKWYLTGPNTGLMLGFDPGVSVGKILPQAASAYSAATVSGGYFASQAPGGSIFSPHSSGTATSSGNGTLVTTLDAESYYSGFTPGLVSSSALTADPLVKGRITDSNNKVLYVVSPSSFLMLNIDNANDVSVIQVFEQ